MIDVLKQIADIERMFLHELKERWRVLYGSEPPKANPKYLKRRLIYRVQELAYGGLSNATRERLRDIAKAEGWSEFPNKKRRRRRASDAPVEGTRLVRTWRGEVYEVTVVKGGVEFEGRLYPSLTAVAKAITGTHWNGPAFFGLRKKAS